MGHITFIHGIMNQPSPDRLLAIWKRDLADGGDGVDLDVYGVASSMVYWADVMYAAATDAGGPGQESTEYLGIEPDVPFPYELRAVLCLGAVQVDDHPVAFKRHGVGNTGVRLRKEVDAFITGHRQAEGTPELEHTATAPFETLGENH
jgi:hypothetical protein